MLDFWQGFKQGLGPYYGEFLTVLFCGVTIMAVVWFIFPFVVLFKLSQLLRLQRAVIEQLERIGGTSRIR